MKRSRLYYYLCKTVGNLDDVALVALYMEMIFNNSDEWYKAILAEEIANRPEGLDTLLALEVNLYDNGILEAYWPMHVAALINFRKRGDLRDVIRTLSESENLENAVKIVGAACDRLPESELNDETIDMVARILRAAVD